MNGLNGMGTARVLGLVLSLLIQNPTLRDSTAWGENASLFETAWHHGLVRLVGNGWAWGSIAIDLVRDADPFEADRMATN